MKDLSNRQLLLCVLTAVAPYALLPLIALAYLSGWRFKDIGKE